MQAIGLAPGGERAFAMERWPLAADADGRRDAGRAARRGAGRRARARRDAQAAPIVGSDRDARMIESARRNADARRRLGPRDARLPRRRRRPSARAHRPRDHESCHTATAWAIRGAAARGYRDLGACYARTFAAGAPPS